jgi:hypothetical protein
LPPKYFSEFGQQKKKSKLNYLIYLGRDSSVGIATGYGLDGRGVGLRILADNRKCMSSPQAGSGNHPASYLMGLSPEIKRQRSEANHSLPYNAEVNMWSYTSTPPYVFMV